MGGRGKHPGGGRGRGACRRCLTYWVVQDGVQFNAASNRAQQSLAVIDLNTNPAPAVVQNI